MQDTTLRPLGRKPSRVAGKPVVVTCAGSKSPQLTAREVQSEDLLGEARQLRIIHAGSVYTLRATANNRLILTK